MQKEQEEKTEKLKADPTEEYRVLGIDLGTTNSCTAFLLGQNVVVSSDSKGQKTTPSALT